MPNQSIRLVMSNAGENNNKFWFADIDGATVHRQWGRVGKKAQEKTFHYESEWEATSETERLAQSKRRKGYRDVDLADGTTTVGKRDLKTIAHDQIKAPGLESLIDYLVQVNIHAITSSTSITIQNGQLCSALGPITPQAVQEARTLLHRIGGHVRRKMQHSTTFTHLVEDYLMIVPMDIGMKRWTGSDVFLTMTQVQEQENVLDAMESFQAITTSDKVFDTTLEKADHEISRVQTLFDKTSNRKHGRAHGRRVKAVYEVHIANDKIERGIGNLQELWHGTKAHNILSILRTGMKIVPSGASHTTGRMYGDGLYFSDQSSKSFQYVLGTAPGQAYGGTARNFMLLCEVAMGRAYTPSGTTRHIPAGYNSCYAKAGRSGVRNNEHVVYKETQARIKYLVEFS